MMLLTNLSSPTQIVDMLLMDDDVAAANLKDDATKSDSFDYISGAISFPKKSDVTIFATLAVRSLYLFLII
jgi:hypothetical protein